MGITMRKIRKALAMGDLILCLALAGAYGIFYGQNGELKWRQTAAVNEAEEKEEEQTVEIRKIALTFDDEVIIGLSQEICCIEAISLI